MKSRIVIVAALAALLAGLAGCGSSSGEDQGNGAVAFKRSVGGYCAGLKSAVPGTVPHPKELQTAAVGGKAPAKKLKADGRFWREHSLVAFQQNLKSLRKLDPPSGIENEWHRYLNVLGEWTDSFAAEIRVLEQGDWKHFKAAGLKTAKLAPQVDDAAKAAGLSKCAIF